MFVCVVVLLCTFSVSRFLLDLTGPSLPEIRPSVLEIRPPVPEIRFPVFAVRIRQLDEGWWMRGRHFLECENSKMSFKTQKFLFSSKNFDSRRLACVTNKNIQADKIEGSSAEIIIFGNFF
jgi:hypothetical protein